MWVNSFEFAITKLAQAHQRKEKELTVRVFGFDSFCDRCGDGVLYPKKANEIKSPCNRKNTYVCNEVAVLKFDALCFTAFNGLTTPPLLILSRGRRHGRLGIRRSGATIGSSVCRRINETNDASVSINIIS